MKFFVYKITNLINQKIYIGKTVDIDRRWREHISIAKRRRTDDNKFQPINAAIRKYGIENFQLEIVSKHINEQNSFNKETELIEFFRTQLGKKNVYNITAGGEGLSGYKHTQVAKDKISKANSGTNNPMFGMRYTRSKETRAKISKLKRGAINGVTKITIKDVKRIRKLLSSGMKQKEIANQYGLNQATISLIATRKRWGYIK